MLVMQILKSWYRSTGSTIFDDPEQLPVEQIGHGLVAGEISWSAFRPDTP